MPGCHGFIDGSDFETACIKPLQIAFTSNDELLLMSDDYSPALYVVRNSVICPSYSPTVSASPVSTPSPGCVGESPAKPATTCLDVEQQCGNRTGIFWVQPNGNAPAYQAYCVSGGWTLAMRIDGSQNTFVYNSSYWTDDNLLNPDPNDYYDTSTEIKAQPFLDTLMLQIMIIMYTPDGFPGDPLIIDNPQGTSTLASLFAGGYIETDASNDAWHNLVHGGATYQNNCNAQGFNIDVHMFDPLLGGQNWHFRLGILYNEQDDCESCDTAFGIGADTTQDGTLGLSAGQYVSCCQDVSP